MLDNTRTKQKSGEKAKGKGKASAMSRSISAADDSKRKMGKRANGIGAESGEKIGNRGGSGLFKLERALIPL